MPGILAWAVAGCQAWQEKRLTDPDEVTKATADYRGEMDIIGQFLADCCFVPKPLQEGIRTQSSVLYEAFCKYSGEHLSQTAFSTQLTAQGYTKKPNDGRVFWVGIGLLANEKPEKNENDRKPQ